MKRVAMAVRGTLALMVALTGAPHAARAAENKACALLTPAELQEALGAKVSGLTGGGATGSSAICGAVEVTAKAQKDMVPIEKLRPLAEKIAARL